MKKKSSYKIFVVVAVWFAGLAAIGAVLLFVYRLYANRPNEQVKVYRIGILSGLNVFDDTISGFKAQMSELGYVENKNIIYDIQKFDSFNESNYTFAVKKFVDDRVDLIFAFPTEAALAAKAAAQNTSIPVVFAHSFTDGVELVKSGDNITGVRLNGVAITTQSLDILLKITPHVKRVWVPYQKDFPMMLPQISALRSLTKAAGVTLVELPSIEGTDLEIQLMKNENFIKNGEDVFLLAAEPLSAAPGILSRIFDFSKKHGMPIGGIVAASGNHDVIFGINPERTLTGKQAAIISVRILKGVPAKTIPVVDSRNYFQINLLAAEKFGLKISEDLIGSADQIIR